MIERRVFAQWMAVMADVVGRPLSEPSLAMYFAVLSAELTTEKFETAMAVLMRSWKFNVHPKPAEILGAARPADSPELAAGPVWDRVRAIVLGYRPAGVSARDREAEVERELGVGARQALQAAGGARRLLGGADAEEWVRRDFVAYFVTVYDRERHRATIAAVTGAAPVPRLEGAAQPAVMADLLARTAKALTSPVAAPSPASGRLRRGGA